MLLAPTGVALLVALLGGWFYLRWAPARALDIPNERSSHSRPTPRGGGLVIVAGFLAGLDSPWRCSRRRGADRQRRERRKEDREYQQDDGHSGCVEESAEYQEDNKSSYDRNCPLVEDGHGSRMRDCQPRLQWHP